MRTESPAVKGLGGIAVRRETNPKKINSVLVHQVTLRSESIRLCLHCRFLVL